MTPTEPEELNKAALAVLSTTSDDGTTIKSLAPIAPVFLGKEGVAGLSPGAAAAADQHGPVEVSAPIGVRQHLRGDRITITVPDEILAVSRLTGRAPAEIVADLLACQVSAIRTKAKGILGEVVL